MASKNKDKSLYPPLLQSVENESEEEIFSQNADELISNAFDNDLNLTSVAGQKILKRGAYPLSLKNSSSNFDTESGGLKSKYRICQGRKKNKIFKKCTARSKVISISINALNKTHLYSLCIALLFCVVCAILLWVLPCNTNDCIGSPVKFLHSQEWQKNVPGIAISTPLHVIPDFSNPTFNILFGYKSLNVSSDPAGLLRFLESSWASGLLASSGLDGSAVWKQQVSAVPHEMTCNLQDSNGAFIPECIVVGKAGHLGALEVYTGERLWDQSYGSSQFSVPVVLPDLDGDGVTELLTTTKSELNELRLFIISGKRGTSLGKPLYLEGCFILTGIQLNNQGFLSFKCKTPLKDHQLTLSVMELYESSLNGSVLSITSHKPPASSMSDMKPPPSHNMLIKNRDYVLNITNTGSCPYSCQRQVTLLNKHKQEIWKSDSDFAIAFSPVAFNCSRCGKNSGGFVFKLWEWTSGDDNHHEDFAFNNDVNKRSPNGVSSSKIQIVSPSEEIINVLMEEDTQQLTAHYTGTLRATLENRNMHAMRITESLIAVVTNGITVYSTTLSRLRVVQLCIPHQGKQEVCQPDVLGHRQSVTVKDVDSDGRLDLISVTSLYVPLRSASFDQQDADWRLETLVRKIHLEEKIEFVFRKK